MTLNERAMVVFLGTTCVAFGALLLWSVWELRALDEHLLREQTRTLQDLQQRVEQAQRMLTRVDRTLKYSWLRGAN